jgi:Mg-chelatase subunit ChlD
MERGSIRLAALLLAFSVGITAASIFDFRPAHMAEGPPEINEPEANPPVVTSDASLEMVFVIDTTGSMGGLIEGAKQKVWSIVNDVQQRPSRPSVKVGLVAYRDRGDDYVTQVTPLTDDLDKVYSILMDLEAAGGGDGPENVRAALADGLGKANWSQTRTGLAQIIFLVGDAPPHDYQNEPDVLATAREAVNNQIMINTIQCGSQAETTPIWQQIAQYGKGKYFAIAQDGGVETIDTPYDKDLAELGRKIGTTYLAYGDASTRARNADELAAIESKISRSASNTAMADRSLNKAMNKDAYRGDLIQDLENGRIKLGDVKNEALPEDLLRLSGPDREREITRRLAERKMLKKQVLELAKKRDAFIAEQRKKSTKPGGFDSAVAAALNEQLQRRGIR